MSTPPLTGTYRVVDLSAGIAAAYATKILAEAGAEVILVEPPGGCALRFRSATHQPIDPQLGGVFFQFLGSTKASVVADPDDESDLALIHELIAGADAVVWSWESPLCKHPSLTPQTLRVLAPNATVLAITPYGLEGPWSDRAANEFTLQAVSGTAWNHGPADSAPVMVGGNAGDHAIGTAAALALLVSRHRALQTGTGELIDLAGIEVLHLTHIMFPITFRDLTGRAHRPVRVDNLPTAHKCSDGWVGYWVTTGQQWLDFCTMVGREDWLQDASLGSMDVRGQRSHELVSAIDEWVAQRTVAEAIELASLLRVPVAPIGRGDTLPFFDHMVEKEFYVKNPRTGVTQPRPWYTFSDETAAPRLEPSPVLGADTDRFRAAARDGAITPLLPPPTTAAAADAEMFPFKGLRIVDMTAYWAGPIIPHIFAFLGADVIHLESTKRPDGIRMAATRPMNQDGWWETSPFFSGTNTCKRDLALDLQTSAGRAVMLGLIEHCDALIENFSPRVMGQLGLDYDDLTAARPDIIMVRAPAFGISGPWRDRVGYAPTIDQASGLAWITGHPGERPKMVGAASDAVGGLHASIALLLAIEHRNRTGRGMLVESPQIGPGINVTAEQVIEHDAHKVLLGPVGNRSWTVAPQGVYRTQDVDRSAHNMPADDWVAVSVENDEQWAALCTVIGRGDLAEDATLSTVQGRRSQHDRLDEAIGAWCASMRSDDAAAQLAKAGVPASPTVPGNFLDEVEPVKARGYYELVPNPVAGPMRIPGAPIGFQHRPAQWNRTHAPLLGEHNRDIIEGLLGMPKEAVDKLEADGVIGTATTVNLGW